MKNGNGNGQTNGHIFLSRVKLDVLNYIKTFIDH